ncbi:MAG: hypothetical protein QOE70_1994 [Chthoniobacter sp.]|jgi:signal transduction histidine kinase|nr:hypothetical protein [Chthoniobacter sp.]
MLASSTSAAQPDVPFEDVAGFARKLIHDVRNGLNALDLQLASILELADDPSMTVTEDVKIARRLLGDEARWLAQISSQLRSGVAEPVNYQAADLIEDVRARIERLLKDAAPPVEWTVEAGTQEVVVDFEFLSTAIVELVRNAGQFREGRTPLQARAAVEEGAFVLELIEPHASVVGDPASWGRSPFRSSRRGAYGLGLFAARRALAALGGELKIRHDEASGELRSRIILPLAPA